MQWRKTGYYIYKYRVLDSGLSRLGHGHFLVFLSLGKGTFNFITGGLFRLPDIIHAHNYTSSPFPISKFALACEIENTLNFDFPWKGS